MFPEFHPDAFDVDVCVVESVLTHVTVVPAAMSSSSGMKARFRSDSAPTGIVTDKELVPGGAGVDGVGDGDAGDDA